MKKVVSSRLVTHIVVGGLIFSLLCMVFTLDGLIVLLNGAFGGSIAGLLAAFSPLLYSIFRNREPYTRAQEMAIGWFALWVAYVLVAYVSVWNRAIGEVPPNPNYISALSRYVAVYAAIRQVSAPDYGLGFMYGRDRKILWASLAFGLVVATALWIIQDQALLSGLVADMLSTTQTGPLREGKAFLIFSNA